MDRGPLGRFHDIVANTVERFLPLITNHDVRGDPLPSDDKIYQPQARQPQRLRLGQFHVGSKIGFVWQIRSSWHRKIIRSIDTLVPAASGLINESWRLQREAFWNSTEIAPPEFSALLNQILKKCIQIKKRPEASRRLATWRGYGIAKATRGKLA